VSDNSNDAADLPTGAQLAAAANLTQQPGYSARLAARMPRVPASAAQFIAGGLNRRAVFFGCDDPTAVTLVYLPNTPFSYPSGVSTAKLEWLPQETAAMVANGVLIAAQGSNATWGQCLACGILLKEVGRAHLPTTPCASCLQEYCWTATS
jgi:lysophospholipase